MRYAKYKPTGIAWLPEVPEGWEMVRNKTFLTITDEKVGERKDEFTLLSLTKQGVIVRDLTEMKGKFPKDFDTYLVVRPDNLVFCLFDVDETPRTVGLVRNVGMLTGAYTNFKVDNDLVLPEFACYYYLHVDDAKKLRPYYTGLRKVVKTNTFLQLRFPCPPLSEQQSIVAYLDEKCGKVDRLVTAKEKEAALLKELKQSMIAEAVTRGVRPKRRLVPSGIPWLPEVPEGWKLVRNKTFLKLTDEKVGSRKNAFTLLSLTKQGVIVRDLTEMKGKFPKDFDTYLVVRPNNLVFCLFDVDETPRTVGLVKNVGMLTGAYTNFEVDQSVVLPEFAYYYYLHVDNAKKLRPYYTGLRKVVKTNTFMQLRMPVPSLAEQREIVAHIEARAAKIDAAVAGLEREVAALKEYKQRLIADVVTGQRKVA